MRIWLVSGEYPPMRGGVADYAQQLAQRLAGQGCDVVVVTSQQAGPPHTLVPPDDDPGPGPLIMPVVRNWGFGAWRTLAQLARWRRPDLVHLQYQAAAYDLHPAANLLPWWLAHLGLPTVTTMHDLRVPYLFPKAGPLRPWAINRLLRDSAAIITTNPGDMKEVAARMRESTALLRLIPLAVQVPCCPPPGYDRNAWRAHHALPTDGDPLLAYFGMLNHSKGLVTLFQALARVRAWGVPARLLMAGEEVGASDPDNRAYRDRLHNLADDLDITPALVWTGYLAPAELSAALLAADLAVLPFVDGASYRRGSLLVVLAHGLPLVTTHGPASAFVPGKGSALPVLRYGEQCLLTPPEDADALAGAIVRLCRDPELRRRLCSGARRTAAAFSWDRVLSETLGLYEAVLARPGAS